MEFPRIRGAVKTLAQKMIGGYANNSTKFTKQKHGAAGLQTMLNVLVDKENGQNQAYGVYLQWGTEVDDALAALETAMKEDIGESEKELSGDDTGLKLIGWGAQKSPTPVGAPGAPRQVETMPGTGQDAPGVDWKSPGEGGKPLVYEVVTRANPADDWAISVVVAHPETEAVLHGLKPGRYEVAVRAKNRAGTGPLSSIITVVL